MRKGRDGEKQEKKTGKKKKREKTDENRGHYVIASSRPPERRPLERRTLAPKEDPYFSGLLKPEHHGYTKFFTIEVKFLIFFFKVSTLFFGFESYLKNVFGHYFVSYHL